MNVEKTHSCRREQDKEPVGYMRQQQHIFFFTIFFHSHLYIFASECCSPIFISFPPFISPISFNCLSLTVPSSRFPHQIFCSRTTAAPFLQSSPLIHTTDILAHCLVSLSMCTQKSQSLGHFSGECLAVFRRLWGLLLSMLFYCTGCTVQIGHQALPLSKYARKWRRHPSESAGHIRTGGNTNIASIYFHHHIKSSGLLQKCWWYVACSALFQPGLASF